MNRLQLRVLYRQFLFRIVDLDVLSAHAQGDASKLLGQFAALLVFVSAGLSLPAIFGSSPPHASRGAFGPVFAMITQHLLIATTMLAVGIFAVLSWDSVFPDRRDVMVLAPLPVHARTMFLAKVAAVATALGLTIALLHAAAGLFWPLSLAARARPATLPALRFEETPAPVEPGELEGVMNRGLRQALASGDLAPGTGTGVAIGVWKRGERRVFTYGVAKSDSLFEIGSISKTFTGLLLARMVAEGKTRFDEPVRELLPPGTVAKPAGREITLADLATHHSGLPRMPGNFRPADHSNPYADYAPRHLYAYLKRRGVSRPRHASYLYSNLGLGLLGQALAERAGRSYAEALRASVTGPLGMNDTTVQLTEDQQRRFLQGHNEQHQPVHAWDLDALAGAGALRSTAGDMVTYLAANLHPEQHAALAGTRVALPWMYDPETATYYHGGSTAGFNSFAFFHPASDCAAVVLMNNGPSLLLSAAAIGAHVQQRLLGKPAISLETAVVPAATGIVGVLRSFAAYWFTMVAAGVFVYGLVLSLQGVAAQALPRRLFLRVSGYLQLGAFAVIVSVYFLQPGLGGLADLTTASLWRVFQWLPSYWFLGLYQQVNGSMHPALEPLARRAWLGLAAVLCVASASYALAYLRTMRQIVEEPDIAPGARHLGWLLPRFGGEVQTAIGQFSVRTLARSRQHRMLLAFYLGVGLALTSLLLKDPSTQRQFEDSAVAANPWSEASVGLWAASMLVMVLAVVGTRIVFALPLDVRANWIFRLTGVGNGPESRAASRRALVLLAVAPVWVAEAAVCAWLWPSWQTGVHLAVLALVGLIAAEICLLGLRKIPFACSYLPGKSQFHMAFLGAVGLLLVSVKGALLEREAVDDSASTAILLASLVAVWAVCRWIAPRWLAAWRSDSDADGGQLRFEEEYASGVQLLGLNRDGVTAIEKPQAAS